MLKVVRAKLHGIRVTGANLNYHGSITLDPEHVDLAGLYPMEFVEIWNKNSGARLSTYVIYGERGSRCCILNGAAARMAQVGDELIVCASEYCEPGRLYKIKPKILTFLPNNEVDQTLRYDVFKSPERPFDFRIIDDNTESAEECHTYTNVDITVIREDLGAKGWNEDQIDEFCRLNFAL